MDGRERREEESEEEAAVLKRQKRGGGDRQLTFKDIVRKLKTLPGETSGRHQYKMDCRVCLKLRTKTCTVSSLQHIIPKAVIDCFLLNSPAVLSLNSI